MGFDFLRGLTASAGGRLASCLVRNQTCDTDRFEWKSSNFIPGDGLAVSFPAVALQVAWL
jgi:hypothetical protein